ncbi:MAG: hypothetical protein IKZ60_07375 [Bacteroidales bacterium]|nr:hypothetical protein [Bacteroidales bacterium]
MFGLFKSSLGLKLCFAAVLSGALSMFNMGAESFYGKRLVERINDAEGIV